MIALYRVVSVVVIFSACVSCVQKRNVAHERQNDLATSPIFVPAALVGSAIRLDGMGRDAVWAHAVTLPPLRLSREHRGAPRCSTRVSVVGVGRKLLFGVNADENCGIIAFDTIPGDGMGNDDTLELRLTGDKQLRVMVNPLGNVACRLADKTDQTLMGDGRVLVVAHVTETGWRIEAVIDAELVCENFDDDKTFKFQVVRRRQARGCLEPFEQTAFPGIEAEHVELKPANDFGARSHPVFDATPPQQFAGLTALEVVLCTQLPANAEDWKRLPAHYLIPEDESIPTDAAFQPTEVRAALNGTTLALAVTCREKHMNSMQAAGQALWREDNLELFVGPERHGYLQLICGPGGHYTAHEGRPRGRNVKPIRDFKGASVKIEKTPEAWNMLAELSLDAVCAAAGTPLHLRPTAYPWVIQITRNRPQRDVLGQAEQSSLLSATHSATAHCPLRFARIRPVERRENAPPTVAPAAAHLPPPVLSPEEREALRPASALERWIASRKRAAHRTWEEKFASVSDLESWNALAAEVRGKLLRGIFPATDGAFPPKTPRSDAVVYDFERADVRYRGLIQLSPSGVPVPGTLVERSGKTPKEKRPALVIIPAHHTHRNHEEPVIAAANFARAGGIALIMESIGSGERGVTARFAHKREHRNLIGVKLLLAGETLEGWTVLDVAGGVDYLLEQGADPARIAILGGVAGGGDVAALIAAAERRFTAAIPFNFGSPTPFAGYCDSLRAYYGANAGGYNPWMTAALIAPRRLLQAREFDWTESQQAQYDRFKKVYAWHGVDDGLDRLHGGKETHALHFAALHRIPLYRILNRWFHLQLPEAQTEEFRDVPPSSKLQCFDSPGGHYLTGKLRATGRACEPNAVVAALAARRLSTARDDKSRPLSALRRDLAPFLGDIQPLDTPFVAVQRKDLGVWEDARVEGFWLPAESSTPNEEIPGLGLALWVLTPISTGTEPHPLFLGVAQAGKARFLFERRRAVRELLKTGAIVALLDVRGTGETSPGRQRLPEGPAAKLAAELWLLADNLPARQLQDVRTALHFLAQRPDADPARLTLWGEGFSAPNGVAPRPALFDETGFRQTSPTPKELVEPAGGWLALLAAMYPVVVNNRSFQPIAVRARGTLASFASILNEPHHYVPMDAITPGLLRAADIEDVIVALRAAGVSISLDDLRDGQNRAVRGR